MGMTPNHFELLSDKLSVNGAFTWEKFDLPHWQKWMSSNVHVPLLCLSTYLVLMFSGKQWMKNKQPFRLRQPLILWNIGLATFSFMAFWRTLPYLLSVVWDAENWPDAFYKSVCSSENLTIQFAFWSWVGVFSKIAELGDTAFIVLRKQPLIFLHWYHHAATMMYTWYTFPAQEPCHRILMTMNYGLGHLPLFSTNFKKVLSPAYALLFILYFHIPMANVHVIMYSYYAIRAGGIKLPRVMAMIITSFQILQMAIGMYVNYYTWMELDSARGCERYKFNLIVAAIMYTSYLFLFANFFHKTYFKGTKAKRE